MAPRALLHAVVAVALLAGCRSDDQEALPSACRTEEREVRSSLAQAPDRVELAGTPLSRCLVKASEPGDIQEVGAVYLAVAAELGAATTRDPESHEALQLGYLIGAVERGSERTQGIHSELLRRLRQEAAPVEGGSAAFARGERAGRRNG